jgi:hypothetical protein
LIFSEIAKDQQGQRWRVGGRERSSFLNVLALDVKYLYSNTPGGRTLDHLLTEAQGLGIWRFKQVLKALKPDNERGHSLKLVSARPKPFTTLLSHAWLSLLSRRNLTHVRKSHPNTTAGQAAPLAAAPLAAGGDEERQHARGVISTEGGRTEQDDRGVTLYRCTVAGCSRSYKTPSWLARHINSNHSGLAVSHCRGCGCRAPQRGDGERHQYDWSDPKRDGAANPCVLLRRRRCWSDWVSTK